MAKVKLKRVLHVVAAVLIVVLAVGLYKAKSDASRAEAHVRALETQVVDTEADMRALRAEIAHLETPERVEALAERHLGMQVGSESTALPAQAIEERLPAPRAQRAKQE